MRNHVPQPRSFNTIRHSQTKERAKRRRQMRMVLLSACVTALLLLLSLLVLLIASIADAIGSQNGDLGGNGGNDGDGSTPPIGNELTFEQVPFNNETLHTGTLILVNADHQYTFPSGIAFTNIYDNRTKINGANIYQVVYNNYTLQKDTFEAFDSMMQKYYVLEADASIIISSAYRSYKDQEDLPSSTIRPGYSDHHTGYCVTIQQIVGENRRVPEADHWIYQNCHKYGFVIRYPDEKAEITGVSAYENCLRYVGIPHASYMQAHGLCLEEYVEQLRASYSVDHRLKISGADGKSYEVYYVPSSGEELTTVRVPKNHTYTISGDNENGFIVTVDMSEPIA